MTSIQHQHDINLSPLLAGLEQPLQLVSNPEARARLQAYIDAARPQVERAAFDLLAGVIAAINTALPEQRASLEYVEGGLRLRVEETQDTESEPAFDESDLDRVTIRLPKELKELIDMAAERHGISANTWYVRALSRAAGRHMRELAQHGEHEGHRERRRRRGFYRGRGRSTTALDGANAD